MELAREMQTIWELNYVSESNKAPNNAVQLIKPYFIVPFIDAPETYGILMEHIEGCNLATILDSPDSCESWMNYNERITSPQKLILSFLEDISSVILALYFIKTDYTDLKPHNIMWDSLNHQFKVIDVAPNDFENGQMYLSTLLMSPTGDRSHSKLSLTHPYQESLKQVLYSLRVTTLLFIGSTSLCDQGNFHQRYLQNIVLSLSSLSRHSNER